MFSHKHMITQKNQKKTRNSIAFIYLSTQYVYNVPRNFNRYNYIERYL